MRDSGEICCQLIEDSSAVPLDTDRVTLASVQELNRPWKKVVTYEWKMSILGSRADKYKREEKGGEGRGRTNRFGILTGSN